LSHPAKLGPEALKHLKASWNEAFGGVANSHKTAILEEGMEWKQMSMSSEDAQFLQTRQYQGTEIARIYRVPPHMIGDLTKSSFSNIEQQAIDFVRHTMMPRLIRWEQAISRDMILKPDIYYPQFVVDGLLRGDTKSRYEAYSKAITDGWLTPNEVRAKENLNPLPGLDEPRQQLNMAAVSDEKESPDEEKEEKNDEEKEE
jgi:HK97 family phage portal protein